jgi:predicted outer membrane protein
MRKLLGTMLGAALVFAVGAAGGVMAAPSTPAAGSLEDARIAQRVLAFARAEVQTANAVKARLSSPGVWQLAQRMSVDDAALEQKFGTFSGANPQLESAGVAEGQAGGVDLSQLWGDPLETAYVEREINAHTTMLAALDGELIASAKSEDLRRGLIDLRAETVAHLGHAIEVRHDQRVRALMAVQPEIPWPR